MFLRNVFIYMASQPRGSSSSLSWEPQIHDNFMLIFSSKVLVLGVSFDHCQHGCRQNTSHGYYAAAIERRIMLLCILMQLHLDLLISVHYKEPCTFKTIFQFTNIIFASTKNQPFECRTSISQVTIIAEEYMLSNANVHQLNSTLHR